MERISDKRIQQVIRESVDDLLLEYGGVSDEILTISKDILNTIIEKANDCYWMQSQTNGMYFKRFSFNVPNNELLADCEVNVKLLGYRQPPFNFAIALDEYNEFLKLGYAPSKHIIFIYVPYPSYGEIDDYGKHYLLSSINHEVKHAYQSAKRKGTSISQAYLNSREGKDFGKNESNSIQLLRYYIKNSFYFFDQDEIDARLQEIYVDLTEIPNLAQSQTNNRILDAIKGYNYIKYQMIFPTDKILQDFYQDVRNDFPRILKEVLGEEMTPKMFFNYCDKGIQRYKQKLRRILGRFHEEQGITNGSFKQYSQNEIPQGEIFRKKPSLWQRMFNNFKKR